MTIKQKARQVPKDAFVNFAVEAITEGINQELNRRGLTMDMFEAMIKRMVEEQVEERVEKTLRDLSDISTLEDTQDENTERSNSGAPWSNFEEEQLHQAWDAWVTDMARKHKRTRGAIAYRLYALGCTHIY